MKFKTYAVWRWLLGNILVLAGLLLAGIAVTNLILLPRLRSMLAQAVRSELSLPDSAHVDLRLGSYEQTLTGLLPNFHVDSPSAVVNDIPFQGLRFDATQVDFNMRQIIKGEKASITSVGSAELTLRMSAREMEARLVPMLEDEGITNVSIEFNTNAVKVTGEQDANMAAEGQFFIAGDNRVGFRLTDFQFSTFNITVTNLSLMLDDFLPALDLGGMFADIVIDDLSTTSEFLEITAHAEGISASQVDREVVEVF